MYHARKIYLLDEYVYHVFHMRTYAFVKSYNRFLWKLFNINEPEIQVVCLAFYSVKMVDQTEKPVISFVLSIEHFNGFSVYHQN